MLFNDLSQRLKTSAAQDMTLVSLRALIIVIALGFIAGALLIKNKWVLAAMLAYIVFP